MAFNAYIRWLAAASDHNTYQYILSLDLDDPTINEYRRNFGDISHDDIVVNPNKSYVEAVNVAASRAIGDCIIVMSDDFDCPKSWDMSLSATIAAEAGEHYAILVDDCYGHETPILTLPIISRSLYVTLGYIYYPEYYSMFADNDITELCKRMGVLHTAPLKFRHRHYSLPEFRRTKDLVAEKQNHPMAYKLGEAIYKRRVANNFGLM